MSNAQLDALIAYANAVNDFASAVAAIPEANTPEIREAVAEVRRRLDDLHRAMVPGASHLTLVKS
jgi:hypothetical protein